VESGGVRFFVRSDIQNNILRISCPSTGNELLYGGQRYTNRLTSKLTLMVIEWHIHFSMYLRKRPFRFLSILSLFWISLYLQNYYIDRHTLSSFLFNLPCILNFKTACREHSSPFSYDDATERRSIIFCSKPLNVLRVLNIVLHFFSTYIFNFEIFFNHMECLQLICNFYNTYIFIIGLCKFAHNDHSL